MSKPAIEFTAVDGIQWTRMEGAAEGLLERILARTEHDGVVTRLLRFEAGADSTANGLQVHDFWEEIYIVDGSITDVTLGETFAAGSYACRPPGMPHGPWRSPEGAVLFEVRYLPPGAD